MARAARCTNCAGVGHRRTSCPDPLRDDVRFCGTCERFLPISYFGNKNGKVGRFKPECKDCLAAMSLRRYHAKRSRSVEHCLQELLTSSVKLAKKRGQPCTITLEYLLDMLNRQNGTCYYTGRVLTAVGNDCVSVDRIDPSVGYVEDNVVLVCWIANQAKWDLSMSDFVQMCKDVAAHCSVERIDDVNAESAA